MKKIILSLTGLLLFSLAYSQKINYQKTYDIALAKAKAENKLLFVFLDAPKPNIIGRPELANAFKSGIDDPEVIKFFNATFVNYIVLNTDSASTPLKTKYPTTTYPTYFFIDGHDNLVYRDVYNSSQSSKYINMGNKALANLASGRTLTNYEDKYKQGNASAAFIKDYITLRQELGLFDNAKLADDYVGQLTIKSFDNYDDVLFVLKAGPYAYGKTYNLCYTNKKITDSIYKKEPINVRTDINNRIIINTTAEAIRTKNIMLAQQASNYASSTWSRQNSRQGQIAAQNRMLYYYRSVKDTASYFRQSGYFYDAYYMNISADSAKKVATKTLENLKTTAMARHGIDTARVVTKYTDPTKPVTITTTRVETVVKGNIDPVASTLNNAAYTYYTLGTHNQTYLLKALLWSKRSIELEPSYGYYDTLAHLLYRLGFFDEALSAQNKAVSLAETENLNKAHIETLKAEAIKIKTRKLS